MSADNDHARHHMASFKQCGKDVLGKEQFTVIGNLWEKDTKVIVMELTFVGLEQAEQVKMEKHLKYVKGLEQSAKGSTERIWACFLD